MRGAHKGEGLGNQFLAHIREVDAIVQVARCFEDANVVHVENRVDPVADIDTVTTELCLKDLDTVHKRGDRARKMAKANIPIEKLAVEICEPLAKHLDDGKPARTFKLPDHADAAGVLREMHLLTAKPTFYVANVDEGSLAQPRRQQALPARSRSCADAEGAPIVPICAALEAQIAELDPADRPEFLASAGLKEPGLHARRPHGLRAPGSHHVLHRRQDRGPRLDDRAGARRPRRPRRSSTPTSRRASSRPRSSGGRTS